MGERPSFWLLPLFLSSRAWGQVDEGGKGERFTQSKGFSITCNVLADNTPIDKVRKIIWTVEQPPSNYFGKHRPPLFVWRQCRRLLMQLQVTALLPSGHFFAEGSLTFMYCITTTDSSLETHGGSPTPTQEE